MKDNKPRLTNASPVALPSVCRKLHQDTAAFVHTATYQLVTFKFVSLVETWRACISADVDGFTKFLRALPASVARFEVVGVMGGRNGLAVMDIRDIAGCVRYESLPRNEAKFKRAMKRYICRVFPKAEITFRVAENLRCV